MSPQASIVNQWFMNLRATIRAIDDCKCRLNAPKCRNEQSAEENAGYP